MIKEKITIANLKCEGCETSIINAISKLPEVESVAIDSEHDQVLVVYDNKSDREIITNKLLSMGYPEATEENGLLLQIKSYASCMVGRVQKKAEEISN